MALSLACAVAPRQLLPLNTRNGSCIDCARNCALARHYCDGAVFRRAHHPHPSTPPTHPTPLPSTRMSTTPLALDTRSFMGLPIPGWTDVSHPRIYHIKLDPSLQCIHPNLTTTSSQNVRRARSSRSAHFVVSYDVECRCCDEVLARYTDMTLFQVQTHVAVGKQCAVYDVGYASVWMTMVRGSGKGNSCRASCRQTRLATREDDGATVVSYASR